MKHLIVVILFSVSFCQSWANLAPNPHADMDGKINKIQQLLEMQSRRIPSNDLEYQQYFKVFQSTVHAALTEFKHKIKTEIVTGVDEDFALIYKVSKASKNITNPTVIEQNNRFIKRVVDRIKSKLVFYWRDKGNVHDKYVQSLKDFYSQIIGSYYVPFLLKYKLKGRIKYKEWSFIGSTKVYRLDKKEKFTIHVNFYPPGIAYKRFPRYKKEWFEDDIPEFLTYLEPPSGSKGNTWVIEAMEEFDQYNKRALLEGCSTKNCLQQKVTDLAELMGLLKNEFSQRLIVNPGVVHTDAYHFTLKIGFWSQTRDRRLERHLLLRHFPNPHPRQHKPMYFGEYLQHLYKDM